MATTRRKTTTFTQRQLPYTIAGDPRGLRFQTFQQAIARAMYVAEREHDWHDGEEYRHGVLLDGTVVGTAVRHPDGSITARRYAKGES